MTNYSTYTYRVPENRLNSIIIDIELHIPVRIQGYYPEEQILPIRTKALIDTGASRSAIKDTIVKMAKLGSYGLTTIRTSKEEYISTVYKIDVLFPNNMIARNIKASEFSGRHDFDFIIGMDILCMADMAITNAGGVMVFSLRSPPADKHIDFTKQ